MDNLNDNALMLKVKAGDIDKMGLLFERYHRPLYGFFYHMTKQKELSEDMVQNVFFRMLKYRHSFTVSGQFKTWMYHIARNVMNDHYKQAKKLAVQHDIDFAESPDSGQLTTASMEKKQEIRDLLAAIDGLNKENREILILCRFQDLKYKEIAQIIGITEGAVKVRVHRALMELKNSFLKMSR